MIGRVGSQASEHRTERSDGLNPLGLRSGRCRKSRSLGRAGQVIPPSPTRPARSPYYRPNDELSALINPKYKPKRKFQLTEKHVFPQPEHKAAQPSSICRRYRYYRTFPSVLGEGLEGESVDWKVRDSVSSQTIKVIMSSANPHR